MTVVRWRLAQNFLLVGPYFQHTIFRSHWALTSSAYHVGAVPSLKFLATDNMPRITVKLRIVDQAMRGGRFLVATLYYRIIATRLGLTSALLLFAVLYIIQRDAMQRYVQVATFINGTASLLSRKLCNFYQYPHYALQLQILSCLFFVWFYSQENPLKSCHQSCSVRLKYASNRLSAGASSETPPGKLTTLLQTPQLIRGVGPSNRKKRKGGEKGKEMKGEKGKARKERKGKSGGDTLQQSSANALTAIIALSTVLETHRLAIQMKRHNDGPAVIQTTVVIALFVSLVDKLETRPSSSCYLLVSVRSHFQREH